MTSRRGRVKQGKSDRDQLPVIGLIVPFATSIEDQFADRCRRVRIDAREWLHDALILLAHEDAQRRAQVLATMPTRRATSALARAVKQMGDVDLDTAWRAALRGDDATMRARLSPHVDARSQARKRTGSPWRESGWLTGRAQ